MKNNPRQIFAVMKYTHSKHRYHTTLYAICQHCMELPSCINPFHGDVDCRQQVKFSKLFFFKNVRNLYVHCHIWIHHEKCIRIITNKPSFGSVTLEILHLILRKYCQFSTFVYIALLLPGCKALWYGQNELDLVP